MKHSKVKQPDLDRLVPAVLFQEQSEANKQVEKAQRELEKSGRYMQHLNHTCTNIRKVKI